MSAAADRGLWMAECAARREPAALLPAEVVVTFTGVTGQVIDQRRVEVATGDSLEAVVMHLHR